MSAALAWVGQTLDQMLPDDELAAFVFLAVYIAGALMLGAIALEELRRRVR